jgi:hypothetical protein
VLRSTESFFLLYLVRTNCHIPPDDGLLKPETRRHVVTQYTENSASSLFYYMHLPVRLMCFFSRIVLVVFLSSVSNVKSAARVRRKYFLKIPFKLDNTPKFT